MFLLCVGVPMKKTMLIAIKGGLPQSADPIECGDIVGKDALLGNCRHPPKISRHLEVDDFVIHDEHVQKLLLRRGAVLWEGGGEEDANSPFAVDFTLFLCGRVTSTFDALWYLQQQSELEPWTSLLASCQAEGRGQMRREWVSPRGNVYVSLILPEHAIFQHEGAAIALGYLVTCALRALGYDVYLKWPNDIVTADFKKVGGILIEERNGVVMAGIGLNLVSAPEQEQLRSPLCFQAGTLSSVQTSENKTVESFLQSSPFLVCKELVNSMIVEYTYSLSTMNFATVMKNADTLLTLKGKRIRFTEDAPHQHSGLCLGLGCSGGLLIQCDDGHTKEVTSGSVSLASYE